MKSKLRVAVLFGGRSVEHEVSCRSSAFVLENLDPALWEPVPFKIEKEGHDWIPRLLALTVDAVFPVLHGTFGEDGTLQGLLDLADLPYVGSGTLGSAVGMDKEVAKRLAAASGIPVVPYLSVRRADWTAGPAAVRDHAALEIGLPCFVKPANLGSSVGVMKVKSSEALEFEEACAQALRYDDKILIEKAIPAREIECAVLGDASNPQISVPGEIVPSHEFYSYQAKYLDEQGAALHVPARLTADQAETARGIASRAFQALECHGMARVDLFLDKDTGDFYFNEVNTIPGFTEISMYPKLWEASGIPPQELVTRLLRLALERHEHRRKLRRSL